MNQKKKLYDEIAIVAYALFENSGRPHGCDLDNWLQAEKIVREAYAKDMAGKAKKPAKVYKDKA